MQTECKPGNIYTHYRNCRRYVIKSICIYGSKESSLPNVAIYYDLDNEGSLYYRDVADFNEVLTWNVKGNVWRYKYLGNLSDPEPNVNLDNDSRFILQINKGELKIRDSHIEDFVEDNYDLIEPTSYTPQRRKRFNDINS